MNHFFESHFDGLRAVVDRIPIDPEDVKVIVEGRFEHDPDVAVLEEDQLADGRTIFTLRKPDFGIIARYTEQPPSL